MHLLILRLFPLPRPCEVFVMTDASKHEWQSGDIVTSFFTVQNAEHLRITSYVRPYQLAWKYLAQQDISWTKTITLNLQMNYSEVLCTWSYRNNIPLVSLWPIIKLGLRQELLQSSPKKLSWAKLVSVGFKTMLSAATVWLRLQTG